MGGKSIAQGCIVRGICDGGDAWAEARAQRYEIIDASMRGKGIDHVTVRMTGNDIQRRGANRAGRSK
jgi:hypothetical protein